MKKDEELEKLLLENISAITDYIRGSKNLEEAKENLRRSGFEDEAIEKILKNMDRKNIIKFPSKNNYEN